MNRVFILAATLALTGILFVATGRGQLLNLIHSSKTAEQSFGNGSPSQPWPITSVVNAINYDSGGSGIGYTNPGGVNPSCLYTSSFRPDTVNFKASTAGPPYQLGCSAQGNAYKYTVAISGSGPFTITANLADSSAGGSWGVALDGSSIGTIATPNTGGFTTFQGGSLSSPFNATAGNHTLQFTALGGDASFNGSGDFLSFQVAQASGIPCGIGPNYVGAIPAGAQAAGFTTCAANYLFTNSFYGTLSNWLDCAGASSPQWYATKTNGGGVDPQCSRFSMVADGSNPQVLHEQYLTTDRASSSFGSTLTTVADNNSIGQNFPMGAYWQVTYRLSTTILSTVPSGTGFTPFVYAWWSYQVPGTNVLEWDFQEDYSDTGAAATWHDHGNGNSARTYVDYGHGNVPGFDPTVYNTYGTRLTFNGTTAVEGCSYLNNGSPTCSGTNDFGVNLQTSTLTNRFFPILMLGPQNQYTPTATQDAYIKQVVIFTCSAWQTTECTGPLLTGAP